MAKVRIEEKDLAKLARLSARFVEAYVETLDMEPALPGGGIEGPAELVKRTNELLDHACKLETHIRRSLAVGGSTTQ